MKNEFDYLNDVKMDFDIYENESISEKEIKNMTKNINKGRKIKSKKLYVLAASIAVIAVTCTAFASGYVGNIIKSISTGYNSFIQMDSSVSQPVPDELKGKLFDENGIALENISEDDIGNFYDAQGNKLSPEAFAKMYEDAFGGDVMIDSEYNPDEAETVFASIEDAQQTAIFDIKIPEYLPEGYTLSKIYGFNDDNGNVSGDYITIVYTNEKGTEINVFERIINEQTKFTASTDGEIKEVTVNGRIAALTKNSIDWETEDNVSVGIIVHENFSENEIMKIAQSVK